MEEKAELTADDVLDSEMRTVVVKGREVTIWVILISLAITAVIMVITVYQHKNKYRPLKTFGLSLMWAGIMNLPIWWFIRWLAGSLSSSPEEGEWGIAAVDAIRNSLMMIVVICVIVLISGIAAAVLAGKAAVLTEEGLDDGGYGDNDDYDRRGSDYE